MWAVTRGCELPEGAFRNREVRQLLCDWREAGQYTIKFAAEGLSDGMYVCRIEIGATQDVRSFLIIR